MELPKQKVPVVFYRARPHAGAIQMACWHASLPTIGRGTLGSPQQPFHQSHCASVFCFTEGRLVALHGFIKKTQKTPDDELKLARKRMREFK